MLPAFRSVALQGRWPQRRDGGLTEAPGSMIPINWSIIFKKFYGKIRGINNTLLFFYFLELFTANSSATRMPAATVEGRNPATRVPLPSDAPAGVSTTSRVVV
jgi:hypothetical protein